MNCSLWKSPSSRAIPTSAAIWSLTRRSCSSASATGATTSANFVSGAATPGIVASASASSRYCTIIIAWLRSSSACA